MPEADWSAPRRLAERLRFSGDHVHPEWTGEAPDGVHEWRELLSQHEVRIAPEIMPTISRALGEAATRLGLSPEAIDGFVFESPVVNASCVSDADSACIVRVSSGLAKLLSGEEMQFVFGHEIAHHLFGHSKVRSGDSESIDALRLRRAGEISADRVGFVACGSLDVAIRAMLKVTSGLPDDLLRFDIRPFLAQLESSAGRGGSLGESHPSMGVRCRAVMWFASEFDPASGSLPADRRRIVDERIARDLRRFTDATATRVVGMAVDELCLWMALRAILEDGVVSKAEQQWLRSEFGDESAASAIRMIRSQAREAVRDFVNSNIDKARGALRELVPTSFAERERECRDRVAAKPD